MLKFCRIVLLALMILFFPEDALHAQDSSAIDKVQLDSLIRFAKATYADEIMVIHKNREVVHWKSGQCDSLYFGTASMMKSWTGIAIGILVDQGLIRSEEDLVCDYLPEWKAGCRNKVTIRNLLTMSGGFNRRSGARGILGAADSRAYALYSEPDTLPNIRFGYSNVSVQLLGFLMENVTGKDNDRFYREALFDPLGMDSTRLRKDLSGKNYLVYGGAPTTLQDAAQFGKMMLNNGMLNGQRIVSVEWIEKSTTASGLAPFYGYLFWIDSFTENRNYAAMGDLGQMTIVYPELELIFLRRQKCNPSKFSKMEWMGPDFVRLVASVIHQP
jgi:CubicO group peptidase (beta-lactamase class C family)